MQKNREGRKPRWASRLFGGLLAGALVLAVATPVLGAPSAPKACNDGIDNDGDSLVDYPADPGCASRNDNDEFNAPPPTGCVGVAVPAGANLVTVFGSNGPGTTYCLAAGNYTVPFSAGFNSIIMEQGDVVWGAGKASTFINGDAVASAMFGGTGYTFRDLSVGHAGRSFGTGSCPGNSGACGIAFNGSNVTLLNMRCYDNGTACAAYSPANLTMDNVECDTNGWRTEQLNINAACVKAPPSGGNLTVRNSNIHDNYGDSLWADFCGRDSGSCIWLIENNTINHNGLSGVKWEVSGNFHAGDFLTVRNNTIQNNGWNTFQRGGVGALINSDSSNVDAYQNTFGGNLYWFTGQPSTVCCRGAYFIEGTRDPAAMYNVLFHNNTMNGDIYQYCAPAYPGVTCSNNTP